MTALGEAVISGSVFGGRPATPTSHVGGFCRSETLCRLALIL
jgi:hypothetical protein